MTREEQQKDDIEVMKILFNADINELCNQHRFNDAREMEGIRDRLIQALEAQPTGMRDATEEERKSVKDYVDSISKPTGVTFNELLRDCKTCIHSDKGNCAYTEECHECMWESKYEQQPNRCDSCKHLEERDGSICYECVKGMSDNFEPQSTDAVSREAVINVLEEQYTHHAKEVERITGDAPYDYLTGLSSAIDTVRALPPVTPTNEDTREAYLKGYDYGVKDWFKSKTQPREDCISRDDLNDAISELTYWHFEDGRLVVGGDGNNTVYKINDVARLVHVLPPVTPQRPKGKWIEVDVHNFYATLKCSVCDRVIEPYFSFGEYSYEDIKTFYPYCHCGAEMIGGGEE